MTSAGSSEFVACWLLTFLRRLLTNAQTSSKVKVYHLHCPTIAYAACTHIEPDKDVSTRSANRVSKPESHHTCLGNRK